jgi:PIN domain nuclease of toxin-antitoxin system
VRFLLDTHLLLWAVASSKRLPPEVRDLLDDTSNDAYFSAASVWEIAIKSTLRRKDFVVDLAALEKALPAIGLIELPVSAAHAAGVARLPHIHEDPFDRLLIAQSIAEPLTFVTNDAVLERYSPDVRVV